MEKVKIDVIVPVYNVEQYIKYCLESLISQTIPIHIIVVNDGSTDTSDRIIRDFCMLHPQIEYITQENAGLSAARNAGLVLSTAPYIAFLDSDDYVASDYYETLLLEMERLDADIVCSNITFTFKDAADNYIKPSNTLTLPKKAISNDERKYPCAMLDIFPMVQNKLWKASFLRNNQMHFIIGKYYEDIGFFYEAYPFAKIIGFVEHDGFYYRQRKGSIIKGASAKILDITDIYAHLLFTFKKNGQYDTYKEELEYSLARNCLVASSKRLSYSKNYEFITTNLRILYNFVGMEFPQWRDNKYLKPFELRNIYMKLLIPFTIPFFAIFLILSDFFSRKKSEYYPRIF
ncbi:glycosyl transferase [Erysipelotrichaceae bacterium]|nr:glycosyl transferase [Erysipelotrichaceae bacterium]